jgi:hypothetical protein
MRQMNSQKQHFVFVLRRAFNYAVKYTIRPMFG